MHTTNAGEIEKAGNQFSARQVARRSKDDKKTRAADGQGTSGQLFDSFRLYYRGHGSSLIILIG
jgi:hypothetical protein